MQSKANIYFFHVFFMFSSKSHAMSHLQYIWAHIYWTFSTFKESFHGCSHKLQLKGPVNLLHQLRLQSRAATHPRSCNHAAAESCLQPHSISCTHGVITVKCQINIMDNIYKGKMIAVVYLEKAVYEAHDINSDFSMRKFTSKLAQNNEQERGEERKRRHVWMQDIKPNGNQRTTVKCQSYYRFMLHLLPWGEPHIGLAEQNKRRGEKKVVSWFSRCKAVRKEDWEMKCGAREESSPISWVLFSLSTVRGGLRGGRRAVHPPPACWTAMGGLHSLLFCTAWFFRPQEWCGKGQLWWWCWVVYQGEEFRVADLCTDAHDGHKSRYQQKPLNNQSFWEVDAKWRCGIKKKRSPVSRQLCDPAGPSRLISWQNKFNGCHVIQSFQHHCQRTAVVPLPQFAAPQAACWERCTTPPTAGLALPDTHDS